MSMRWTGALRYRGSVATQCIALALAAPVVLTAGVAQAQFFDEPPPGTPAPWNRREYSGGFTSSQSTPAVGFISIGGGDIGPLGNGSRSENVLLTYRSGTLSLSGDGGIGISAETRGGDGRSIARGKSVPGGAGGSGGDIEILVESDAAILTSGLSAHGIHASSAGGNGGDGGNGRVLGPTGKPGGAGGDAGSITIATSGRIVTEGTGAYGVYAVNAGGKGGNGGDDKGIIYSRGGKAGIAGGQYEITLDNRGSITTSGENGIGIFAKSLGGGGGDGGDAKGGLVSIGGRGGNSGEGGDITLTNSGSISTSGSFAPAISLESTGGGGGLGGSALAVTPGLFNLAIGGGSGSGGDGGKVKAINSGDIVTGGTQSQAIKAASTGGGGGTAGSASAIGIIKVLTLSIGGSAGDGGKGGAVEVSNNGSLKTLKAQSEAILATSTGGGGGQGGAANSLGIASALTMAFGGSGGAASDGGAVTVANGGRIATEGVQSTGISALSLGGGGGVGGVANLVSINPVANLSFTIGGNGGGGGNGGFVHVHNGATGTIDTQGVGAAGIKAQSIGGGGGNGGVASGSALTIGLADPVVSAEPIVSFNMALGGKGGGGGAGGPVTVGNEGRITTVGDFADGIFAQSVGRGGGDGGFALTRSLTVTPGHSITISPTVGGEGGIGGRGGGVLVDSSGEIRTTGANAIGILVQSIGGGGGKGGGTFDSIGAGAPGLLEFIANPTQATAHSLTLSIAVGGKGGIGNLGDNVIVKNSGAITTKGANAFGIAAQSLGGGGGLGGNSQSLTGGSATIATSIAVGGQGGGGNHGGTVDIANRGTITTGGSGSAAIFAQSIGGGGGHGGNASNLSGTLYESIFSAANAAGGVVSLKRALDLAKDDPEFLKSWGQKKWDLSLSVNAGATVGGSGGAGGSGSAVKVANTNTLTTLGQRSPGIFAQSVGGGGGNGGISAGDPQESTAASILDLLGKITEFGTSAKAFANFKPLDLSLSAKIDIGGKGGAAGDGGRVEISNSGAIRTNAAESPGILAQSIGGGGGNGGRVAQSLVDGDDDDADQPDFIEQLNNLAGLVDLIPLAPGGSIAIGLGGDGGAGGNGGRVTVDNTGIITTQAASSEGIFAQSVGGGGGNGGSSDSVIGSATLNLAVDIGGKGGAAGSGGEVVVRHGNGSIFTGAPNSAGILAQSVGGGGGKAAISTFGGGLAIEPLQGKKTIELVDRLTTTSRLSLGASGAGVGRDTGHGGAIDVSASGRIVTVGEQSAGIVAQSIGGGGGTATLQAILTEANRPKLSDTRLSLGAGNGARGDGGKVTVTVRNSLRTSGANAFGVLAQSIGGGGGFVAAPAGDVESGPLKVGLGSANTLSGGHGGNIEVQVAGIVTGGRNAHGVVAQSIGGGGGVAGLTTSPGKVTLERDQPSGNGDANSVLVRVDGSGVQTTGDGAIGILAQAIGGGGGLTGDAASVRYDLGLVKDGGFTGGGGEGADIGIRVDGAVTTAGANAPAILAMSLGSGAVFSDQGIMLMRPAGESGNSGRLIDITVGGKGNVAASGLDSPGIYAVSLGNSGAGTGGRYRGEEIRIRIDSGGSVSGGRGERGAGIATVTPALTTITNAGTISSLGGLAIQTLNQALVRNSGVVAGNVLLGSGSAFANEATGRLHSGTNLQIATLTNLGTLNPGGENAIKDPRYSLDASAYSYTQTRLEGSLQQSGSGTYAVDLDFLNGKSDHLTVTGPSTFAGTVTPLTLLAKRDTTLEIARFDQPLHPGTPGINDSSPVFSYQLTRPDPQRVSISMDANFTPSGVALTKDQAEKAAYLQQLWNAGDGTFAPAFGSLTRLQSLGAYLDGLGEVGNDAAGARNAALANEARAFAERMNSCPAFFSTDARMGETDCVWGRSIGTKVDRGGSIDDSGYATKQLTLQVGGQKEVQPGWFLGGSLGYNAAHTTTSLDDVDIRSQGVTAGLVLKRQLGPWLFSASLLAGYDSADIKRDISLPGLYARATGTSQALQLGGKLRASYQFTFGDWYLKPMADLDLHVLRQYGYRERGAGLFDLATLSSDQFSAMVTPALEIGGRFELSGMVTRAYLNGGVSFASNDGWAQKQRFSAAGSGDWLPAFEAETGTPRTYGNVRAGLELLTGSGWELKAEYGLRAAKDYREQSAELRAALRF